MIAFLTGIGGKLAMLAIVIAIIGGLYLKDKADVAKAQAAEAASLAWQSETARLQSLEDENEKTLVSIRAQYAASESAAEAARQQAQQNLADQSKLEQEIANAQHGVVPDDISLTVDRVLGYNPNPRTGKTNRAPTVSRRPKPAHP
jgi:hypothetical protein